MEFLLRLANALGLVDCFFCPPKLDERPVLRFLVRLLVRGKWRAIWETRRRRFDRAVEKAKEAASQFVDQNLFGDDPLTTVPERAWLSEWASLAQVTFFYGICQITVYLLRREFFLDSSLDPESWRVQSLFTITRPADGKGKYELWVPSIFGLIKRHEMPWFEIPRVS